MHKLLVYMTIFSSLCSCQRLVYYCNFDTGLIGDCLFNKSTGSSTLTITSGTTPTASNSDEPLSDITSISKYAHFRADLDDADETYLLNVNIQSNFTYCLDFFYYLTASLDEAKIAFGWDSDNTTQTIVEETTVSEHQWQQSQTTFVSPSVIINQIWFRMTHHRRSSERVLYALDEIKINEGPCESVSLLPISQSDNETSTESTRTVPFETTDEETNYTTSEANFTSETGFTTNTLNLTTSSPQIDERFLITLTVPLGVGIPALLVVLGGLCYRYRKGRQQTLKALAQTTNANELELTETDA